MLSLLFCLSCITKSSLVLCIYGIYIHINHHMFFSRNCLSFHSSHFHVLHLISSSSINEKQTIQRVSRLKQNGPYDKNQMGLTIKQNGPLSVKCLWRFFNSTTFFVPGRNGGCLGRRRRMECAARGFGTRCVGPPTRRCGQCGAVAYCSVSHQVLTSVLTLLRLLLL